MGPPGRRGRRRVRGPGSRRPRDPRPSRPPIDPVAEHRRRPAGRLPGLARARDRAPRQLRRVGHRAPGCRDDAGRAAGLRHGPCRLPGPCRRPRREPAVHAAGGLRGPRDVRPAAVRLARDRDRFRARLPGLAADGRVAAPGGDRCDLRARPASLGRGGRRADRARDRGRRLAHGAGAPGHHPSRGRRGGPVRDPGGHRWRPGPDPARRRGPRPCTWRSVRSSGR